MPHVESATSSPGEGPETYRAGRLHAAWSRVHVDVVEAAPCAHGLRVRAVVDLGELTPADVRVHLVPASAREAASWPADACMWSCESYGNGRVLFERVIPQPADAAGGGAGDWIVVVHPAGAITERLVVYPLHVAPLTRSP